MTNDILIGKVNQFALNVNKLNTTKNSPERYSAPHIHDWCEIYVNLTGNVSFIVEKNIYSIKSGDIIITKPYEYHHCKYNDESDHKHYWITFSSYENPELFDFFLQRKRGTNNLIRLPKEILEKFLELCERLTKASSANPIQSMAVFFEIINYIANGLTKYNIQESNENLPHNISRILNYVNQNYRSIKNINEIADEFHVSITTLERYFKKYLSITPKRYLDDKKLSNACRLLRKNHSVTEACFESGFEDYSHFITIFKKNFGTTPLKYKKNITN